MKLTKKQLKKLYNVYVSKPQLKYVLGYSFKDWLMSYKGNLFILKSMIKED